MRHCLWGGFRPQLAPMIACVSTAQSRRWKALLSLLVFVPVVGSAQTTYQKPPPEVLDVLNAPVTPSVSLSPTRDRLLLVDRERYPSIRELAQPMLGLAGVRINPQNRGPHRPSPNTGLILQTSRLTPHFKVLGSRARHFGPFSG